jgi:hypothetical protein
MKTSQVCRTDCQPGQLLYFFWDFLYLGFIYNIGIIAGRKAESFTLAAVWSVECNYCITHHLVCFFVILRIFLSLGLHD